MAPGARRRLRAVGGCSSTSTLLCRFASDRVLRLLLRPVQTLWMPPTGFVNNCDGGRSHSYCDYRQQ